MLIEQECTLASPSIRATALLITFCLALLPNAVIPLLYPELLVDLPALDIVYPFIIWFQILPHQDVGSWYLSLYTRDATTQDVMAFPRMLLCLIIWNLHVTRFNALASFNQYYIILHWISLVCYAYFGQPLHNALTGSAVYICNPPVPLSNLPLQYIVAYTAYYFLAPKIKQLFRAVNADIL